MHDAVDSISLRQKYTVGAYPLTAFESGFQKRRETSHVDLARNSHPGVILCQQNLNQNPFLCLL